MLGDGAKSRVWGPIYGNCPGRVGTEKWWLTTNLHGYDLAREVAGARGRGLNKDEVSGGRRKRLQPQGGCSSTATIAGHVVFMSVDV